MIGDFENAQRLVQGEIINFDEKYFSLTSINGEQYWILEKFPKQFPKYLNFDLPFEIIEELFFFINYFTNIGIGDEIIKSLTSGDYKRISKIKFSNESTEKYEFFIDGTIILK